MARFGATIPHPLHTRPLRLMLSYPMLSTSTVPPPTFGAARLALASSATLVKDMASMVVDPGVKQVPSAYNDSDQNLNKRSLGGALLLYPGARGDDAWAMVPAKTPIHGQALNVSIAGSSTLERWDNDKRQAIKGWVPQIFKDCDPTHGGDCPYKVGGLAVSIKPLPNPGSTLSDVLVDFGAREADPQQMPIDQLLRAIGVIKHSDKRYKEAVATPRSRS